MRNALQAGMHADSKFKSRQKMNAAKNIQGLNNISAERLVSPQPVKQNIPPKPKIKHAPEPASR